MAELGLLGRDMDKRIDERLGPYAEPFEGMIFDLVRRLKSAAPDADDQKIFEYVARTLPFKSASGTSAVMKVRRVWEKWEHFASDRFAMPPAPNDVVTTAVTVADLWELHEMASSERTNTSALRAIVGEDAPPTHVEPLQTG